MSEDTGSDRDDGLERQAQQRVGFLRDELTTRHMAYRRQLEAHLQVVQQHLGLVHALTSDPSQRVHNPLPQSYRKVREAQEVYDAAAEALRQHIARH